MLRVKEGDLYSMGVLFTRFHRELFGFFYHMYGDADACEDMVQTAFYRMIKYKSSFTGKGPFRSWMYQLGRNVLRDHVQQNKRSNHAQNLDDYTDKIGGGTLADESLQKSEQALQLRKALARLSNAHREVLVMSEYQELKYKEIAEILDITEGAVKTRVHRAINELKITYLKSEHER
jgi:RNA polymerase sigma factor (sigma-70 family)